MSIQESIEQLLKAIDAKEGSIKLKFQQLITCLHQAVMNKHN